MQISKLECKSQNLRANFSEIITRLSNSFGKELLRRQVSLNHAYIALNLREPSRFFLFSLKKSVVYVKINL
ncbi:hypothetical protein GCM10022410_11210 [Amphibacillus indicireducens]|uniref:Transposase n=1 Tax=Amphibacillus indicireducens TaxID=1076330 RepID=A0ABP7VGZ0_9BACI